MNPAAQSSSCLWANRSLDHNGAQGRLSCSSFCLVIACVSWSFLHPKEITARIEHFYVLLCTMTAPHLAAQQPKRKTIRHLAGVVL